MYRHLLINVDELWLKGKNRPAYFSALGSHIKEVLKAWGFKRYRFRYQNHRFILDFQQDISSDFLNRLSKIPGVYSIVPCQKMPCDFSMLAEAAVGQIEEKAKNTSCCTFKVRCRRVDKKFPHHSMEVAETVGRKILELGDKKSLPLKVNLGNPDVMVDIKILPDRFYLSTEIIYGLGGLPLGMSGHLVTLISGGFDSPVASYMMSRRGCLQTYIFFHSYPFVEEEVLDKVLAIFRVLGNYQRKPLLYSIPFGNLQQKIVEKCHINYRTMFFRYFMLRGASILAKKVGAEALLTGDCLSQVSSQTIANICLLDKSVPLPVFRPLLGFNKSEIMSLARKVGTHDISLLPQNDACALLSPEHPVLVPKRNYWDYFLECNDFEADLSDAINDASIYRLSDSQELEKVGVGIES